MFGEKLKELRKKLKLRQAQVANVLGIKQDAVSKIEHNIRNLTSFEIFKLSKEYDIPIGFFFGEVNLNVLDIYYKATKSLVPQDKVSILKKIANRYYDIEDVLNMKDEYIFRKYTVKTNQIHRIREIANEERRILGFDETEPITNLEEILSSYGIKILKPILEFPINGMFLSLGEDRYLIVINNDNPPSMKNFALAHEYGHYLFQRDDNFNIVSENIDNPSKLLYKEKIANMFAAEFLMPERGFDNFKVSEDSITIFLQRYKVSRNALIFRLDNLNKIRLKEKTYFLNTDNFKPIESLKRLGFYNEEVDWYKIANEISNLPRKEREKRKILDPRKLLSDDYKDKVITAYEKDLISYKKICDYLFVDEIELKKTIKQKEVTYEI